MEEKAQDTAEYERIKNMEKSKTAENLFKIFLNDNKIPYYYIDQSIESYSYELYDKNISRPDFITHTNKGIFYIDVKHRKLYSFGSDKEERFYLNHKEINRLSSFQNTFDINVWVAFIDVEKKTPFFYTSISDIQNYYLSITDIITRKYSDSKTDYENWYIYIPKKYLFNNLSYYNGFSNQPEISFYEKEAESHKERAKYMLNKEHNNT